MTLVAWRTACPGLALPECTGSNHIPVLIDRFRSMPGHSPTGDAVCFLTNFEIFSQNRQIAPSIKPLPNPFEVMYFKNSIYKIVSVNYWDIVVLGDRQTNGSRRTHCSNQTVV